MKQTRLAVAALAFALAGAPAFAQSPSGSTPMAKDSSSFGGSDGLGGTSTAPGNMGPNDVKK